VFVYPKLPAKYDFRFIRYRGSGLANCLFVVARAHLISQKYGWILVNPTWGNLTFGTYLRNEKDKRHYFGLFRKTGISGLRKLVILFKLNEITIESAIEGQKGIVIIEGLGNYFEDLLLDYEDIHAFITSIFRKDAIIKVERTDFINIIGIHIRLGDYITERRTALDWYLTVVNEIIANHPGEYRFFVFSDGYDSEINQLLALPGVVRVFFGNAISDIIGLSRCRLILGSDSTFSGWAAFINQTPIIFPKRHFGRVLLNQKYEYVDNGDSSKLKLFLNQVL